MPPRVALVLFVSLIAIELLPPRASLTNATTEADDIPPRAAFATPAKQIPVAPAERCGPDQDAARLDLRRALFGDDLEAREGEGTTVRRAVRAPAATAIRGNITLVRDAHPLR